ncbi:hypothetical protein ACETU7_12295 [Rhodococcus sp. 3Y1]
MIESADEADLEALIEQCRRADTALLGALDMLIADIRIREEDVSKTWRISPL